MKDARPCRWQHEKGVRAGRRVQSIKTKNRRGECRGRFQPDSLGGQRWTSNRTSDGQSEAKAKSRQNRKRITPAGNMAADQAAVPQKAMGAPSLGSGDRNHFESVRLPIDPVNPPKE